MHNALFELGEIYMLILPNYRIWDFWTIHDGDRHHLYCLKAPEVGHPSSRHDLSVIAHATSMDLVRWQWHEDVLNPGANGAWDDLSLWTGSVIKHNKEWIMFYTGRNRRDRTQNLGLAISDDLYFWEKSPSSPVLQPDPRWYVTAPEEAPDVFTWRDPYVVYDPSTALYYVFLASHDRSQPQGYQGAIGLAHSPDLHHWSWLPPVLSPGCFRDMEVPTVIQWNAAWYLFISVKAEWYHPSCPVPDRTTGTLCFRSERITGPFELVGRPLVQDHWYAARPIVHGTQCLLLGWRMGEEEGYPHHFLPYTIDNPRPLFWDKDNRVHISTP